MFIDTAGLREARDEIEIEGIPPTQPRKLEKAEFILHVLDVSEPLTEADKSYLTEFAGKKRILVRNKIDLPGRLTLPDGAGQAGNSAPPVVGVCCVSGKGIELLKDAIKNLAWSGEIKTEMLQVMINSRHQDALTRARKPPFKPSPRYALAPLWSLLPWTCASPSMRSVRSLARLPPRICWI